EQAPVTGDGEARTTAVDVDSGVDRTPRRGELLRRQNHAVVPVELDLLGDADTRVAVHILEVGVIEAVLAHLLDARLDRVVVRVVRPEALVGVLRNIDELPLRLVATGVVPGEDDARVLAYGKRAQ